MVVETAGLDESSDVHVVAALHVVGLEGRADGKRGDLAEHLGDGLGRGLLAGIIQGKRAEVQVERALRAHGPAEADDEVG